MLQTLNLPDWLPWWVPLVLLVPTLLWALSFLFMPFSVFGVKSRLEVIEARLEEIQSEMRHVALRLPMGGGAGPDYDDVYPARMQEPRTPDRILSRPPIPPARHELYNAPSLERPNLERPSLERPVERPGERPGEQRPGERYMGFKGGSQGEPTGEPALEDRPPPSPNARPVRRNEPAVRPVRAEPRLDWRR
jgi:hypothetical protein